MNPKAHGLFLELRSDGRFLNRCKDCFVLIVPLRLGVFA